MDDRPSRPPPRPQVVERMLHEGFAAGNPDIVDELCSPDMVEHQFGLSGVGPAAIEKVKRGILTVHGAFPGSALHGRRHRPERRHRLDPRRGHRDAHRVRSSARRPASPCISR